MHDVSATRHAARELVLTTALFMGVAGVTGVAGCRHIPATIDAPVSATTHVSVPGPREVPRTTPERDRRRLDPEPVTSGRLEECLGAGEAARANGDRGAATRRFEQCLVISEELGSRQTRDEEVASRQARVRLAELRLAGIAPHRLKSTTRKDQELEYRLLFAAYEQVRRILEPVKQEESYWGIAAQVVQGRAYEAAADVLFAAMPVTDPDAANHHEFIAEQAERSRIRAVAAYERAVSLGREQDIDSEWTRWAEVRRGYLLGLGVPNEL